MTLLGSLLEVMFSSLFYLLLYVYSSSAHDQLGDSITSIESTDDFFNKLDNNQDGDVAIDELIHV